MLHEQSVIISIPPGHELGELVSELLAHAAVDCEVDGAGETHEGVDGQHDVVCQIVVHPVLLLTKR